jgi:hypothetical protein
MEGVQPPLNAEQVAAMHQALMASQQQVQQLQAQLQQLAANQAQPQIAAAPACLKPPKPTFFAGSGKDKASLEDWLFTLGSQFAALPAQPSDLQKINYVASYFTGTALKWWRLNAAVHTAPDATYQAFVQALVTAFAAPNAQQKARETIDILRQTTSVAAYSIRFRELLLEVPSMQPAEALHRYITGLKPAVKQHVLIANPVAVDDAMALADRVDQAAYGVRPVFGVRARSVNGQGCGGAVPMEIGAVPMSGRVRTKLTPQVREYLLRNNGCVYCRKLGHSVQQCRLLVRNQRPGQRVPVVQGNVMRRSH